MPGQSVSGVVSTQIALPGWTLWTQRPEYMAQIVKFGREARVQPRLLETCYAAYDDGFQSLPVAHEAKWVVQADSQHFAACPSWLQDEMRSLRLRMRRTQKQLRAHRAAWYEQAHMQWRNTPYCDVRARFWLAEVVKCFQFRTTSDPDITALLKQDKQTRAVELFNNYVNVENSSGRYRAFFEGMFYLAKACLPYRAATKTKAVRQRFYRKIPGGGAGWKLKEADGRFELSLPPWRFETTDERFLDVAKNALTTYKVLSKLTYEFGDVPANCCRTGLDGNHVTPTGRESRMLAISHADKLLNDFFAAFPQHVDIRRSAEVELARVRAEVQALPQDVIDDAWLEFNYRLPPFPDTKSEDVVFWGVDEPSLAARWQAPQLSHRPLKIDSEPLDKEVALLEEPSSSKSQRVAGPSTVRAKLATFSVPLRAVSDDGDDDSDGSKDASRHGGRRYYTVGQIGNHRSLEDLWIVYPKDGDWLVYDCTSK